MKTGEIKIYNTLTKTKQGLHPLSGNRINFFVCGPTVYDYPHLGHAKTYTQFDFIVRYLRFKGYDVFYLQNITDVDDKIIQRAQQRGVSWDHLAREFEAIYLEDMKALDNVSVTQYARATEFIDQVVNQVERLLALGVAYRTSDGVYYDLTNFPDYGKLSGRTESRREDAISRIDESSEKRNWNDFCLWKTEKPGEPSWHSSLGRGRPGWHIEDTAITEAIFGAQYDAHGGAIDLIFPHHEAEIAQMEAISGLKPMVRYWIHTGFLNIDSKKMSKSFGNFTTIRDALTRFSSRVLRFFFLSTHYRTTIDFNDSSLVQAQNALDRIDEFIFNINKGSDIIGEAHAVELLEQGIFDALDDDFNTPRAFASIFEFIRTQNAKGTSGQLTYDLFRTLNDLFRIFRFDDVSVDDNIAKLVAERQRLRAERQYHKADQIRTQLLEMGIQIYDTSDGVKWKARTSNDS
jgi:cysteinyl-tRNA synthetase